MRRTLVTLLTLSLVAVVAVGVPSGSGATAAAETESAPNPWLDRRVLVIAHAGGEDENPHSTLYAYKRAQAAGVDMLEADLRITADGVVVVHHDATVTATTGAQGTVSNMTYAEVFALDNAYRFTPYQWSCGSCPVEDYIYRGVRTGEAPPPEGFEPEDFTIPEARRLFEEFPDMWLDLEVKGSGQLARDTVDGVVALIEEFDAHDRVVLASFEESTIDYIHEVYPEAVTSPSQDELVRYAFFDEPLDRHAMVQVPPTFNGVQLVTEEFVEQMHGEGLAVWVWMDAKAQEDEAFYRDLVRMGVDGLIVSRPTVGRAAVDAEGATWVAPAVPAPPGEVTVAPLATTATVSWTPPLDEGSAPVEAYTVRAEPVATIPVAGERAPVEVTVDTATTSVRLTGLVYSASYRIQVVATNEVGASEPAHSHEVVVGVPDVASIHPFVEAIAALIDEEIATGDANGNFGPARVASRQAMAAFLWRRAGTPPPGIPVVIPDVAGDHPFAPAIAWLVADGVAGSYDDGTFRPAAPASRQAVAAWLHRLVGESSDPGRCSEEGPFPDVPTGHPFCEAIAWAAATGVAAGYADGTFGPDRPLTRQAAAAWLHRLED
ncbi:MAG: S-layer homology domain-containing protein [Acidimicrobiia bacterium]|nr:S-layer homology domain-containing protein [Acidimicrobiia bacterium]